LEKEAKDSALKEKKLEREKEKKNERLERLQATKVQKEVDKERKKLAK
jgi:hypothetical protein